MACTWPRTCALTCAPFALGCCRRDEITDTSHIEEMLDTLDLNHIQVPVGTRARYVPATDDPVSSSLSRGVCVWGWGVRQ